MGGNDYQSQSSPINIAAFSGGLNTTTNPLSLQENEARDIQNMDFDKFGSVIKRKGYTALNTSAFNSGAVWNSLHYLQLSTGTDYLMGTCGNKLAKQDNLDGTWDDITGSLTITAGTTNFMNWITFKDTAFGTNNVDLPIKWTGTGDGALWTTVADLTKAKYTETFENYVFLANTVVLGTTHNTRVYWSCINEPETWNAADFNEIGFKDGQDITGIKALGDRLVIFKENSIYVAFFTGSSEIPFTFQKTSSTVGCISGGSIQSANNAIIFASGDGLYYFDGANSFKISDKINNTIAAYKNSQYPYIVSAYQNTKNRYWSMFQTTPAANPDRVIAYDTYNNAFTIYKNVGANCFAVFNYLGEERIYFGDFSGYVYRADTGLNDSPINVSTAIDAFVRTKYYHFGDIVNKKGVPSIVVYYECTNATLTMTYSYDLTDADDYTQSFSMACGGGLWDTAVWDTSVWGRSGGQQTRRDLTGRGRLIAFKFSNSILSQTLQVHGLGPYVHLETNI